LTRLESKVKKIIVELIDVDDYITLDALSDKCSVTKRSIQNHLQWLADWLIENDFSAVQIIKKPGNGVKFSMDDESRIRMHRVLDNYGGLFSFDDMARRMKILRLLLLSDEELTIGFLADYFYVSRAIILRDMDWISDWLKRFDMKLFKIQNKGIGLLGNEVSRRNAIAALFDESNSSNKEALPQRRIMLFTSRIPQQQYANLVALYPTLDVLSVITLIEDTEKKFDFYLTDEFFTSLLTHLVICLARLKASNKVLSLDLDMEEYESVMDVALHMSDRILETFGLKLPDSEIAYVCLHLVSYSLRNSNGDLRHNYKGQGSLENLAVNIIEFAENRIGGGYTLDKVLYFGILYHLESSVYRIKNKIHIHNPNAESPVDLDIALFNVIKETQHIFNNFFGEEFILPDDEVEALTLHFMSSATRNERKTRALLLSTGIYAGASLGKHLNDTINSINVVDIISSPLQLELLACDNYDFIISTGGEIANCKKPVLNLSHKRKEDYISLISNFLNTL